MLGIKSERQLRAQYQREHEARQEAKRATRIIVLRINRNVKFSQADADVFNAASKSTMEISEQYATVNMQHSALFSLPAKTLKAFFAGAAYAGWDFEYNTYPGWIDNAPAQLRTAQSFPPAPLAWDAAQRGMNM